MKSVPGSGLRGRGAPLPSVPGRLREAIGNPNAKRTRLMNEVERLPEFAPRAFVRRDDDCGRQGLEAMFLPVTPGVIRQGGDGQRAERAPKPEPPAGNFHWRLDAANV